MTLGRIRNQRGAGTFGCLVLVALTAASIYGGFQYAMPKLRHTSFSDRMNEGLWQFQRQPEEIVRARVIEMAADFDIELKPEQVRIETVGSKTVIEVSYEKLVDLRVWQKTLRFTLRRTVES